MYSFHDSTTGKESTRANRIKLKLIIDISGSNRTRYFKTVARHFGSFKQSKHRGTLRRVRCSAVKSSQLSLAGQYKMCVQFDFNFTSEYSGCSTKSLKVF